jgi:hypothetical protein
LSLLLRDQDLGIERLAGGYYVVNDASEFVSHGGNRFRGAEIGA